MSLAGLPRRIRSVLLAAIVAALMSLAGAQAAQAQTAGPGYYLYAQNTGIAGPCVDTLGRYQGEFAIARRLYQTVYAGSFTEGNINYDYYWQRGFDRAYRYSGCLHGVFAYRYYGSNGGKVRRKVTVPCAEYGGSCYPLPRSYGSWTRGW